MNPFSSRVLEYDRWFEENRDIYRAELEAVRLHLPRDSTPSLEVGVGTGRFAAPLGVEVGLDPSLEMLHVAKRRGIGPVVGVGENLPFSSGSLALVLAVTTLCFCRNPFLVLEEMRRVLKRGGRAVVSIIDRDSPLGSLYEKKRERSPFYGHAVFLGAGELFEMMEAAGFVNLESSQTLFGTALEEVSTEVREGSGDGGFAVVSGVKG